MIVWYNVNEKSYNVKKLQCQKVTMSKSYQFDDFYDCQNRKVTRKLQVKFSCNMILQRKKEAPSDFPHLLHIEISTNLNYLKYLLSSPSNAAPCLASSFAISCTVKEVEWL